MLNNVKQANIIIFETSYTSSLFKTKFIN